MELSVIQIDAGCVNHVKLIGRRQTCNAGEE